jgi:hypothetical protein
VTEPGPQPRPSWSIWDTESAAAEAAEEDQPQAPVDHDTASTEPEEVTSAAAESAPAVSETDDAATRPTDAAEAPDQEAKPAAQSEEEAVVWLGEPSEGPEPAEADDAAAEMEVAATGWQAADRTTEAPGRDWRATELPGARELDDALAALRRRARAPEPGGPASPPAQPRASDEATTRPPGEGSPAQRAYARLRRILPR